MQQPMDSCVCGINTCLESIISLGHICFSHDKHVPVEFWYTYFTGNVNLTKRENFLTSNLYHKRMHSPLHDIPPFLILFMEELFLILFNQMLSIRAFGRRAKVMPRNQKPDLCDMNHLHSKTAKFQISLGCTICWFCPAASYVMSSANLRTCFSIKV